MFRNTIIMTSEILKVLKLDLDTGPPEAQK